MIGSIDGRTDGWMEEWTDGLMSLTDGWTDEGMDGCMDG